jgi:hypothetical protein
MGSVRSLATAKSVVEENFALPRMTHRTDGVRVPMSHPHQRDSSSTAQLINASQQEASKALQR